MRVLMGVAWAASAALLVLVMASPLGHTFGLITMNQQTQPPQRLDEAPPLSHGAMAERFFDIAGRRVFFAGREDGSGEVWSPPFQMLAEFVPLYSNVANVIPLTYRLSQHASSIELATPSGDIRLSYAALPYDPALLVKIEAEGGVEEFRFRVSSRIRPNWPLSAAEMSPVTKRSLRVGGYAAVAFERQGEQRVLVGGIGMTDVDMGEEGPAYIHVRIEPGNPGYLVVAGIDESEAEGLFLEILNNPEASIEQARMEAIRTFYSFPRIELFPKTSVNTYIEQALAWAMVATDRLYIDTPGVGKGYVAGMSVSGSTTGADFIPFDNGRPGFAWYFGRDYFWMSLALSLTNQWDKQKESFRLIERYQDDSGKIMHELPTSVSLLGLDNWKNDFPYYLAAADSTPLYIVALKDYVDASGDIEFLNELWPSVEKAFRWLITTDYDGDGLIDNAEGHGWVEGGPLAYNQTAKGHTTFYLAGVYLKCLSDMIDMARLLDKPEIEQMAQRLIPDARSALEAYWNPIGYYNDRKLAIGGYGIEKTIAPSVPVLFGLCTQERAISNLKVMNDPTMLTPWGARYIASDEPAYDPTLYHAGNVWPLFTGWLTLANYRMGLAYEGFAAFMTNVQHTYTNALGFVGEAYRGDRFVEVGTPHQGWSETAVTQGFLQGLLGLKLNAISREATLSPLLPESIDEVHLSRLRVGQGELNIQITRQNNGTYSLLDRSFGVRVRLEQP